MDDQGTETFFSGFIKRSKYNSVLEKKNESNHDTTLIASSA